MVYNSIFRFCIVCFIPKTFVLKSRYRRKLKTHENRQLFSHRVIGGSKHPQILDSHFHIWLASEHVAKFE